MFLLIIMMSNYKVLLLSVIRSNSRELRDDNYRVLQEITISITNRN